MPASPRAVELTIAAARAASDRKAEDLVALDVSGQLVLTDAFLIASGTNERQVGAILEIIGEAGADFGRPTIAQQLPPSAPGPEVVPELRE